MGQRYAIRAITHVHTEASNGPASEMDEMIGGAIRELLGQDTRVAWSECFTPVSRLAGLLGDVGDPSAVGLIAVTDHMNHRSHRLPEALLRAAAADHRLAASAEVACVERDVDGKYRKAPEVLVYGGPEPVAGPFGPYFGLAQPLVDELFDVCRAPGLPRVQTTRVLRFCAERNLACALAHPFDGHFLSLEATFEVISRGKFVETVNGGFPAVSARILEDFIGFQNRIASGWRLDGASALRWPLARRMAERIVEERRPPLHPWGGSDAHSHDFDRVTIRFLADRPVPTAGDLFRAMLERPVEALLIDGTFLVQGRPGTPLSVVDDVVRIVIRNLWRNRRHFGGVEAALRMMERARRVVTEELGRRDRRQAELVAAAGREFDFAQLLSRMVLRPAEAAPSRRLRLAGVI
ncbi:MAG: hypothetical protein JXB32_21750 [Deltaproteobacteria bacterium]|nr:hypothetical protein [Deltaproteobacteria bacterium]